MKITFLGSGTSQGVPVIACDCPVCLSNDAKDKRLRVSVLIETEDKTLVIDSGPDFRYQMLRERVKHLDAILFTHEHKDHIAGMDDIRAFNLKQNAAMDIYASARVQKALKREFSYVFEDIKYPGVPLIHLHEICNQPFHIGKNLITPIEVMHFKLPVFGFRIGDFTYITDIKTISQSEFEKLQGTETLVVSAIQKDLHISHFTFDEAIAFAQQVQAKQTYFTHISHKLGKHADISRELPAGILLAYDGLTLEM